MVAVASVLGMIVSSSEGIDVVNAGEDLAHGLVVTGPGVSSAWMQMMAAPACLRRRGGMGAPRIRVSWHARRRLTLHRHHTRQLSVSVRRPLWVSLSREEVNRLAAALRRSPGGLRRAADSVGGTAGR